LEGKLRIIQGSFIQGNTSRIKRTDSENLNLQTVFTLATLKMVKKMVLGISSSDYRETEKSLLLRSTLDIEKKESGMEWAWNMIQLARIGLEVSIPKV
jgi:hypothetical protein